VKGDILDPASLVKAMEGVSAIVHLAAVLRTPDPEQIWSVNRDGTRNLIAAAKQYAAHARFIMASTGLVYNMDSAKPGREDDAIAPTLPYPASKVAAEDELRNSGLNWSILRFGFVYGDQDGHLETVPNLARMFKWHPAVRLSMVHHADIMAFVQLALGGAADGRIVNLVDEAPMSIYELAELVDMPIEPSAEPLPNPWWGQLDGSFARSLGFQPQVATVYHAMRDGML
jgi:nucleoside-diphosphate-sugar epimerase